MSILKDKIALVTVRNGDHLRAWRRFSPSSAANAAVLMLTKSYALMLASERASFVTGQTFIVDGGSTIA